MDDKNRPNYFAIIPANVRYDNDISPNAKLLYGEITALCNKMGFCWATNEYFSSLYNLSDRTIRSLLKQLSDKNYIKIIIKDHQIRYIYIDFTRAEENFLPPRKKISTIIIKVNMVIIKKKIKKKNLIFQILIGLNKSKGQYVSYSCLL